MELVHSGGFWNGVVIYLSKIRAPGLHLRSGKTLGHRGDVTPVRCPLKTILRSPATQHPPQATYMVAGCLPLED